MSVEEEIILKGKFENGKLIVDTTKDINRNLDQMGKSAQATDKSSSSLVSTLKKLASVIGLTVLTSKFKDLVKGSLQAAGAMEQVDIALTTMLGSAKEAASLQKDLIEFAKKTPFEIEGIFQTTKQLLAYGIAQEDIIDTMGTLGNIAAGVGVDMGRLALAFGQVKTTGRLMGQDLNQFTQAGVPLLAALATSLGKTEAEILKLKEAGKISFAQVKTALESLATEGGRFFNLMENQSKTFLGTVSNMADSFYQVKIALGQALLPVAKKVVNSMLIWFENLRVVIDNNKQAITNFASITLKALNLLIQPIKLVAIGIKTLISQPLIKWLSIVIGAVYGLRIALLALSANPFILVATAIIGAIGWLVDSFDSFSNSTKIALLEVVKAFKLLQQNIFVVVDAILAKLALLSKVPGFGWTKDLSDSFNDATVSIINDVGKLNASLDELKKDRFNTKIKSNIDEAPSADLPDKTQKVNTVNTPTETAGDKLNSLKAENQSLLEEQKNYLAGYVANQGEAEQLISDNKTLKMQEALLLDGDYALRKQELNKQLIADEISTEDFKLELQQLSNEAKNEALQTQYDDELVLYEENQILMNETINEMQLTQDETELEALQLKKDEQIIIDVEKNAKLVEIKTKKDTGDLKARVIKGKKQLAIEEFLNSENVKAAKAVAGELVALQNSKSRELAAIGKAAAIVQITIDTARGAMAAFTGMTTIIPGPAGVAAGVAAAALVTAYGVEKLAIASGASFAVGTPNIPSDQLANVHKGEMIVPATFSDAIRSGDLTLGGGNIANNDNGVYAPITNINISFEGAQFVGTMNDEDITSIGERLGQLIAENIIPAIPTRNAT